MSFGTVQLQGNHYRIECKPIPKIISALKELPGRKYIYSDKYWIVPKEHRDEVERFAKRNNLDFGFKHVEETNKTFQIDPLPELTIDIPFKRAPFPFQKQGIAYAMDKKRLIIGDDMGLGKSSQSILAMRGLHHVGEEVLPLLIICPSSVKINWQREVIVNTDLKPIILVDSIKNTFMEYFRVGLANVFITNYESLKKYFVDHIDDPGIDPETGKKKPLRLNHIHFKAKYISFFKAIIIDESHRIKSSKILSSKLCKGLAKGKEAVFLLTGTPVVNKPADLTSQLSTISRLDDFGGYTMFMKRFCSGPNNASNLKELNYLLNKHCFYRRDKKDPDIQLQLPDKIRQMFICELSHDAQAEYRSAANDLEKYLKRYSEASDDQIKKSMQGEALFKIGVLKKISARGKLGDVFDFVQDVIDNGQKIVLFAVLTDIVDKVKERFPKAVSIVGDDSTQQRDINEQKFQNDPETQILIGNIKAAGVGLNLTAATHVAFIEQGWHPAIMDQCEDRAFRIGQKNNVLCTYFIGKDTIDEWNYELIQSKRAMANTITGAEDDVEVNIIDSVMNLFNQKYA